MNLKGAIVRQLCLLALFMGAFALFGCGTWYAGLREMPGDTSPAYAETLARHSVRGWRSKGFDHQVSVTATIQTRAFVAARHAEQARLLSLPAERVSTTQPKILDTEGVSVVVFVEAPHPAWERLDRAESDWRFFLEVDGTRYEPDRIRALDGRDATLVHLFPYITRFGRPWLIEFPIESLSTRPALIMTGAPAQLRLEFQLR